MNSLHSKKMRSGYLLAFGYSALAAALIFLPFFIVDGGFFQNAGDYNSQQISFYHYMNEFVKTSAGQWSWETDLGSSAVNSYSFYLLGSPFFWLSCLFPASWSPYLMTPLFILKFGVAGLGAYTWLRRYAQTRNGAVLGACLYALSGFMIYNTFFNHFLDCVALFPFLLWALDEFVYEKRRAVFPVLVAINLLNNYFFFAGQIVFLFLYFFIKLWSGAYRISVKEFLLLAFESLLGCAMGCVLAWPAVLSLADNPRTVNMSSGFGFLLYGRVQQYFAILTSLILPPDPTYLPNIFTDCVIKHTSMTAYLPVVGIAGVLAFVRRRPKSWMTRLMKTCLVMALVPVLNSAFYALNSSYYARWYYMPILIMCAATVRAVEDESADIEGGLKTVTILTTIYIVFAIVPNKVDDTWTIGVVQDQAQFWLMLLTAMLGIVLCFLAAHTSRTRPVMAKRLFAAVMGFSVFYGVVHIALSKFPQWEGDAELKTQYYACEDIDWPEGFYRTDTYGTFDNLGLWMGRSSLQFFNSTVSPSIMDFYPRLGVKRDVSSKPDQENYALRGLLGVKYILTTKEKASEFEDTYGQYGYVYAFEDETFTYFENINCLPMGFACDDYILISELEEMTESARAPMLVRAIGLTEEQAARYADILTPIADEDRQTLNYDTYIQDVASRREQAVSSFEASGSGFTATITLDRENLVFFSVPYDEGFTATVNGVETEIEYVSGGMCAVLCPAGENTIVFTYMTPGFVPACAVAGVACAVWLVYAGYEFASRRRKKS